MEIWYIDLRKSLEIQTLLIFSNVLLTISTRIVRGSDYRPAIALSENKNDDLQSQHRSCHDNVYTKFGLNKSIRSQDI